MNTLTAPSPNHIDFLPGTSTRPIGSTKPATRRPWKKLAVGALLVVAVGAGVTRYVHHAAGFESTEDAFLDGNIHPVSARINGTVSRVLVEDNAHVEAGQPLIELDPADLRLALASSEADLAQAAANNVQLAAQVTRAEADVQTANARIAQNAAQLTRAELDFHRAETLVQTEHAVISQQSFDLARADYDAAQAAQASAVSARASAEAAVAGARAQQAVAQAQIQKAQSAVDLAKLQVSYAVVRAPSSGRVAKKSVEVGQRLQPGQPILAVVNDRVWVVANFKESQLRHLRVGEKVEVKIDAIDGKSFRGEVESFSPGTGAKFSLLPPDNSTGNFTKVVQRVPVKIVFDAATLGDATARLSPGLSAYVTVSVRD